MGLDFWNWDWGGMADGFQANVFTPTVLYRQATGQKNILGDIGHNVFGGSDRQKAQSMEQKQTDAMSGLLGIVEREQQQLSGDRQRRDVLAAQAASIQNPFTGTALSQMLGLQQGSIMRGFADAEDQIRQSLARRGALGTAQETSALRQLALDRARAQSGAEAQTRADFAQRAAGFEQSRIGQQQGILGMMGGDSGLGGLSMLSGMYGQQANQAWERSQEPVRSLANLVGSGTMVAAKMYGGGF